MAVKKRPARRTTVRKKVVRTKVTRRPPRGKGPGQKIALGLTMLVIKLAEQHRETAVARNAAAIRRITHEGCAKCHGTGVIATRGKDGSFTGSVSCKAKPKTMKVSRFQVAKQARFGVNKNSGLMGWRCPCGKHEKPRYQDAKMATKALRTHERAKHGGQSVGGTWYQQLPEGAKPTAGKTPAAPAATPAVTKPATGPAMTDAQWEKQNKPISQAAAAKKGVCWCCAGGGALYSAFGGEQITAVCGVCHGTGKATAART